MAEFWILRYLERLELGDNAFTGRLELAPPREQGVGGGGARDTYRRQ